MCTGANISYCNEYSKEMLHKNQIVYYDVRSLNVDFHDVLQDVVLEETLVYVVVEGISLSKS